MPPVRAVDARTLTLGSDFGPQNVLLDPGTFAVTAVVDWEFAHVGDPVEDLACCADAEPGGRGERLWRERTTLTGGRRE